MQISERLRTALRLAAFIGITALIGVALYFLFFRQPPAINQPPADGGPGDSGSLPQAGEGTPQVGSSPGAGRLTPSRTAQGGETITVLLTTSEVIAPTATSAGGVAYYDPGDGRFYTIDGQGNVKRLAEAQFALASAVTFSPGAEAAVIEFPDGSNIVYDFVQGEQLTIPAHWEEFSFSGEGDNIAAKSIGNDPSNRSLVITAADGSTTEVIAALGNSADKVDVNWSPAGDIVGFSRTGSGGSVFGQNSVYLIGRDGEASGVLIVDGESLRAIWAPDGKHLVYSVADPADDYRAALWYADARGDRKGDVRVKLPVRTLADKCVFADTSTLYCAVPRSMPAGGGSSPALIESFDDLYLISLPSGKTELLAIPATDTQMANLSLTPDGSILYYTDGNGRLGYIRIK